MVTWLNQEPVVHTSTSTTPPFTSGPLGQGQSYSYRFEAAGTYEYYCAVHPSMKGRVIVESRGRRSQRLLSPHRAQEALLLLYCGIMTLLVEMTPAGSSDHFVFGRRLPRVRLRP